jgi:iron complex outermembrane receptor protein
MPQVRLSSLALLLLAGPVLCAQAAVLTGRVLGPDAKPLEGVQVRLTAGAAPARTTTTDAEGRYRFAGLPEGRYHLAVVGRAAQAVDLDLKAGERSQDLKALGEGRAVVGVEDRALVVSSVDLGKLAMPLRDYPQSVSVVPAALLRETGSVRLEEGLRNVSSVAPSSSSNYGFFDNQLVRGQQVVYLRDGLADATTYMGYVRSLWDVEQLEVLKGPGSALFGSGGPGGTVNLTTLKPHFEPAYRAELLAGSWGTKGAMADATGALSDSLAYRVLADGVTTDGYRGFEGKTVEFLPSLLWRISAAQQLLVKAEYRKVDQQPEAAGIPFHVSSNAAFRDLHVLDVPLETRYASPLVNSRNEIKRMSLSHQWAVTEAFTLKTTLATTQRDLDLDRNFYVPNFTSATAFTGRYLRDQHDTYRDWAGQVEGSLRFRALGGEHVLATGLEAYRVDITTFRQQAKLANMADAYHPTFPEQRVEDLAFAFIFDRDIAVRREGLYVADQVSFSERWKARFSLRRDHYRMHDEGLYNNLGNNSFTAVLQPNGQSYGVLPLTLTPGDLRTNEWFWNGQAGVSYSPIPETTFFTGASWGRLANLTTEDPRTALRPESNRQIELGNRTALLEGRVNLTTTVYEANRYNVPQVQVVANNPVVTLFPRQRTRGLEFDANATPLPGWFVLVAAGWMKPVNVQAPAGDPLQGRDLVGTPKRTLRVWSSYELQEGFAKGLGLGAGLSQKGDIYLQARSAGPVSDLPVSGYSLVDAALFYRRSTWEVQVTGKNLGDRKAYAYGIINAVVPVEGRNVQASLRLRF